MSESYTQRVRALADELWSEFEAWCIVRNVEPHPDLMTYWLLVTR